MGKYDNIIDMSRPAPPNGHPRMSIHDRAAQFAGFRALVGHDALLDETARYVDKKIELDESEKEELDKKILKILVNVGTCPPVTIRYFEQDSLKDGGKYISYKGLIEKINWIRKEIAFYQGPTVKVDDIIGIDGDFFNNIE